MTSPNTDAVEARSGSTAARSYPPAISDYPFASEAIGTPSVRSTPTEDVYLTLATVPVGKGPATIGVIVEPLVMWVWVGGGIMVGGTALAAWPGRRRRRPTEPVSAPIGRSNEEGTWPGDDGAGVERPPVPAVPPVPVGVVGPGEPASVTVSRAAAAGAGGPASLPVSTAVAADLGGAALLPVSTSGSLSSFFGRSQHRRSS